jgi:iron complex outermembrane recepter protein
MALPSLPPTCRASHLSIKGSVMRLAPALLLCLLSSTAIAQTAPGEAESTDADAIIVTAQKRSERAFDAPITVNALRGETLDRLGLTRFDDVARYVPGLVIQEQSPNNPGFVIRGITSDDGSSQIAPRVSIFYNGIDISRARGSSFGLFDVERIEVVKGPQSTLFGTAAAIGAVSIISRKAEEGLSAQAKAGFGNFGYWSLGGFLNYGNDVLAARVAWNYQKRRGYIENIAGNAGSQTPNGPEIDDLNGLDALGARLSLRYTPSDRFRADLIFSYDRQTPPGISFKSGTLAPTGGDTSPYSFAELSGSPVSEAVLGLPQIGVERSVYDGNLTMAYELTDAWTITSITGVRSFDSLEVFDADGSQAWFLEFAEDAEGRQFSQEVRANFEGDQLRGFFGGTYFWERGRQRVPFSSNELVYLQCAAPPALRPIANQPCLQANGRVTAAALAPIPYAGVFANSGKINTYSAFADATVTLAPPLEVTLGARYVSETRTSGWRSRVPNAVLTRAPLIPGQVNTNDVEVSRVGRNNAFLPRLNIRYQPSETLSFYATASRGRRSPVVQVTSARLDPILGLQPVGSDIPAELITNYEVGLKTIRLPGNSSLDVSLFHQSYSNFQVSRIIGTGQTVTDNAGRASNNGVEAEFTSRPIEGLQLFGNIAYIDAAIDNKPENGIFAGQRFRLQPKWKGALGLVAQIPVGEALVITAAPTVTYQSQIFFELPNLAAISQDGYALANLRLGLAAADGRWSVEGFLNNAFDKEYLIDAGNTGRVFGTPTFIAGAPRLFGVEASVRF